MRCPTNPLNDDAAGGGESSKTGVVGVLGGMGPLATVDFLKKMLDATPAALDQDHVPVVVSSIPQVPDRAAAYRGEGPSPLEAMLASGRRLIAAGAAMVVIPCNTAHLWFEAIREGLRVPMLHIVDAAIERVVADVGQGASVGLLATDATLASGLYVNRRHPDGADVRWLLPTAGEMTELVMPGIAAVKAGRLDGGGRLLARAAEALREKGAGAIVMGCTEVPLVLDPATAGVPTVDATAALASKAVAWALAQRREAETVA